MNTVECELAQIVISENRPLQVIVLRERDGGRVMPIEIGIFEALAINRGVSDEETVRPMTHDLLVSAVERLGGRIARIIVSDLVENKEGQGTFYGLLVVERDGDTVEIDCRPSDAIAIASRVGCPIYVSESVLEQVSSGM